jgi:hypothetical protein
LKFYEGSAAVDRIQDRGHDGAWVRFDLLSFFGDRYVWGFFLKGWSGSIGRSGRENGVSTWTNAKRGEVRFCVPQGWIGF